MSETQPPHECREEPAPIAAPKVKSRKAKSASSSSTPPSIPSQNSLSRAFTIVVGSYEKLLYGIEGTYSFALPSPSSPSTSSAPSPSEYPTLSLKPVFIFPAHVASVKAVAAAPSGGRWLATGSSDEIIKVWDLKRKKEVGGLMQHQGSITHLAFPTRTHLISASEDGTIALFHTRDWELLLVLKGHKGRVNCVAVHPSGKVALSVGKDRALRMWDLMRGKPSASTMLGKEGEVVRWETGGKRFVVASGNTADVYSTDMKLIQSIQHASRIQDVRFRRHPDESDEVGADELLFIAAEDKKVSVYKRTSKVPAEPSNSVSDERGEIEGEEVEAQAREEYVIVAELVGHANRVKALDMLEIALPNPPSLPGHGASSSASSKPLKTIVLSTCSSDGFVHVYDLASLPSPSSSSSEVKVLEPVAKYDTKGTRLTCMTLAGSDSSSEQVTNVAGMKRGREDQEDREEDVELDDEEIEDGPGEEDENDVGDDDEEEEDE
ncbi:WD40 repeat-like protein [Clavulina sp. PMI_390]|nr:WD40 repeat-like protein [Clavulina sp. PMI_390]